MLFKSELVVTQRIRLIKGIAANSASQLSVIFIQIASVPLFLGFWSVEQYGEWLMVSALPAYFALADAGMLSAVSTKVVRLVGSQHMIEAKRILHTGFASGLAVVSVIMILGLGVTVLQSDAQDHAWTLLCLIAGVCVGQMAMLAEIVFRAHQRYHDAIHWQTGHRLVEFLAQAVMLANDGGLLEVAIAGTAARTLSTGLMFFHAGRVCRDLPIGLAEANWQDWRELVQPALHYFMFPVTGALVFQGSTLVVGTVGGSAAAAVFSTYRTVSRSLVQIVGVLSNTIAAEVALHVDRKASGPMLQKIYRRAQRWVVLLVAGFSVVIMVGLPFLMPWWTSGRIAFDAFLAASAVLFAGIAALAHVPKNFVLAAGVHHNLAWVSLAAAVAACLLGALATSLLGASGMMLALAIGEVAVWLVAAGQTRKLFAR